MVSLPLKRSKMSWFGHVSRYDTLSNNISHGHVEGIEKEVALKGIRWTIFMSGPVCLPDHYLM